jgi:hypothetical protein
MMRGDLSSQQELNNSRLASSQHGNSNRKRAQREYRSSRQSFQDTARQPSNRAGNAYLPKHRLGLHTVAAVLQTTDAAVQAAADRAGHLEVSAQRRVAVVALVAVGARAGVGANAGAYRGEK